MGNHMKAALAGFALVSTLSVSAVAQDSSNDTNTPSTEGVVSSEQSCEYEGGTVMTLASGKICFISVRGEAFNTKAYDNQKLGVIRCSGNGQYSNELVQPSGEYCRVHLEQKKVPPSREEVEAATRATMESESSTN